ncbi:MAG: cation acetate symporter, partial [Pedosphaera sp.]|nr:cation acetate symporter [Pedosphaera sp.]
YACGYLFLLLFIAGPLRRFGAYTIPDFAEGRYDSPVFRKIAVIFVLFIGFFYTMPQMKGAGTTLAYIFPGLDYRWGVLLVGVVITFNVALGGMKGITLVQAVQYWLKMFAISVPIFVLMSVYGNYGKQLGLNGGDLHDKGPEGAPARVAAWLSPPGPLTTNLISVSTSMSLSAVNGWVTWDAPPLLQRWEDRIDSLFGRGQQYYMVSDAKTISVLMEYSQLSGKRVVIHTNIGLTRMLGPYTLNRTNLTGAIAQIESFLDQHDIALVPDGGGTMRVMTKKMATDWIAANSTSLRQPLPPAAPKDEAWLMPFGPLTTKAAKAANASPRWNTSPEMRATLIDFMNRKPPTLGEAFRTRIGESLKRVIEGKPKQQQQHSNFEDWTNMAPNVVRKTMQDPMLFALRDLGLLVGRPVLVATNLPRPALTMDGAFHSSEEFTNYLERLLFTNGVRLVWDKTSIKAMAAADWDGYRKEPSSITFVPNNVHSFMFSNTLNAFIEFEYAETVGKRVFMARDLPKPIVMFNTNFQAMLSQEAVPRMEKIIAEDGVTIIPVSQNEIWAVPTADLSRYKLPPINQRAYSLLYTYSLIIALVCGTAGLPHILVRFYTNPDGVAAKRTTMWVMVLIGVFYLFPPIFGVLGRNILPELYSAVGAKGTDKVVLELPSLLNQKIPHLGSVLSGITCAGAFAAFMSTFSGLLVSMTGALAHDVYGRILRPHSTSEQRLRAFKVCAVIIGAVAILLGMQVEKLDINFMVGQAFAIAAASYFPLLFLSVWWRGMTTRGAACGMLCGGLLALAGISLTSFSDLKLIHLDGFWAAHPLARILCEQPAIWAVPLAIGLMIAVSKLTRREIPPDVRMKMLVLHAPEKLGLKQEYIQEHAGH